MARAATLDVRLLGSRERYGFVTPADAGDPLAALVAQDRPAQRSLLARFWRWFLGIDDPVPRIPVTYEGAPDELEPFMAEAIAEVEAIAPATPPASPFVVSEVDVACEVLR